MTSHVWVKSITRVLCKTIWSQYVTGFAKRGPYSLSNCMHLNWTCNQSEICTIPGREVLSYRHNEL